MPTTSFEGERKLVLSHAVFRRLQPALFRRAEDGQPALAVSLGAEEAVLPLRALRREFAIAADSEDGRMLGLVEQALDYVAGLRPGDPLPAEVLGDGGAGAGFEPTREQQRRAMLRVQVALHPGVSPRAVAVAIQELAAVESLRGTLLERVASFCDRTGAVARAHRGESEHALAATQVARLARVANARLGERFHAIDGLDTGLLLRAPDAVLPAMRAGCDVLHRNRLAWTPTLDAWERVRGPPGTEDWPLIERTYRFLAPRYMSTTEWRARFEDTGVAPECAVAQMIW